MYHLTILWLVVVGAAFVAGRLSAGNALRIARYRLARVESLASELEEQPADWPPIERRHLPEIIRDRLGTRRGR